MAITFIAAGTEAATGSGTTLTPGSPAGATTVGDIWIMAVACAANLTPSAHADWTHIRTTNFSTATVTLWWFRYSGSPPTNNTITTASSTVTRVAGIAAFRGCKASGSPIQTSAGTGGGLALGATAIITSLYLNEVAVAVLAAADDITVSNVPTGYTAGFEDSSGGTQNAYIDATGTPDAAVGLFYKTRLLPSTIGTDLFLMSASVDWATATASLIPEPTHEITGVTRDEAGAVLGSVDVYLLKFDSHSFHFIEHQTSDASTGAYAFQIAESAGTYAVAARKEGVTNVFDITDFDLTPVAI